MPASRSRSRYASTVVRRRLTRRVIGGWRFSEARIRSQSSGVLLAQLLHPPGRETVAHLGRRPGLPAQVVLAAQEVAQHRVDQPPRRGLPQALGGSNRVIHDRVGLRPRELQLRQPHQEEAAQARVPDRGEEELPELRLEEPERTQPFVADLAHLAPLAGRQRRMPAKPFLEGRGQVPAGERIAENRRGAELKFEQGISCATAELAAVAVSMRSHRAPWHAIGQSARRYRGAC